MERNSLFRGKEWIERMAYVQESLDREFEIRTR
jgi:hypothetical protein